MGNFAVDVVQRAPADRLAIVELARDGARREWSFGDVARGALALAAAMHAEHGVRRGDIVLTLVGNQPDWVIAMVACFRQGYVVLPCNEQLRAKDLRLRLDVCPPALVDLRPTATPPCSRPPAGLGRRSSRPAWPTCRRRPIRRRPPSSTRSTPA